MRARQWGGVVGLCWLALPAAWAGQYVLLAGQTQTVPLSVRVLNGEQVCSLEINVPGAPPLLREVRAPYFETRIAITPPDEGSITVTWRGQFKRVQDQLVNACPVQGQTRLEVVESNAHLRAEWAAMQTGFSAEKSSCVRVAFQHLGIRPEWYDFAHPQSSAEDLKIQQALARCDAFVAQKKAWGAQNPGGHPCTVTGGVRTRCEGFYSAKVNGRTQTMSRDQAIVRQIEGRPWTTGVREMASAQSARLKQEQDRLAALAAQEQAKIKAEEDARLRAEQAVQEAKDAEVRARQAKIDALKAQIAEEKERKEKERLENRNWLFKQMDKVMGADKAADKTSDKAADKTPEKAVEKSPGPAAQASAAQ